MKQHPRLRALVFSGAFALALLQGSAFGLKNVYYSVGTNVADLKSGTPAITIAAGIATLSIPQPDNIGVGDAITYNTSAKCYITGRTSGTQYHVVTATGAVPANAAGPVNSIKRAFRSLYSAQAEASDATHLNGKNLLISDAVLHFACYGDGPDSYGGGLWNELVEFSGWTTDANRYIRLYTPVLPTEVGRSQRHNGLWSENAYRIVYGAKWHGGIHGIACHLRIEGLQIENTMARDQGDIKAVRVEGAGEYQISSCLLRSTGGGVANSNDAGIDFDIAYGATVKVWNNIVMDFGTGIHWRWESSSINGVVYGNSVINCPLGGITLLGEAVYNNLHMKNNLVQGSGVNYDCGGLESHANNLSQDATSPNPGFRNKTVQFAGGYHLAVTDVAARDKGADLSAAGQIYSVDIDGQARISPWDIGADENPFVTGDFWAGNGGAITNTNSGYVGIGTMDPKAKLDVNGDVIVNGHLSVQGAELFYAYSSGATDLVAGNNLDLELLAGSGGLRIKKTGEVESYGPVVASSFKVGEWTIAAPDYVFNKDYKLMSLKEVEQFIAKNKHLPGVPSAAEMKKDGVDLAKMNMDLLKKVEELTLYVIELEKRVKGTKE